MNPIDGTRRGGWEPADPASSPPLAAASTWGVQVNECRLNATRKGAQWWFWYRNMCDRSTNPCMVLTSTLGGEVVFLSRESREDAEWIATFMLSEGVPASAVRVMRGPS